MAITSTARRGALICMLALMLASVSAMSGCAPKAEETPAPEPEQTKEPVAQEEPTHVPEEEAETPPGVEMWNPYKVLYFPEELVDEIYPLLAEDGINYTYEFHADISGKDVLLFSIKLGPDPVEDGFLLGQMEDPEQGAVMVNLLMQPVDPQEWTEEEYGRISAYQERINDLIAQFYADESFVPAE